MIDSDKKIKTDIKTIESDIKEIKKAMIELKDALTHIVDELNKFARLEDVKVMQKYIEMWEPVNFVTRSELQKTLSEITQKKK